MSSQDVNDDSVLVSKVNKGQRIKGIYSVSDQMISGKIVSRGGKATGKYKHW